MKRTSIIAFAAGALATGSLALLIATGPEHEDHKGMDGVTPDEMQEMQEMSPEEMMAAVAKLATPNEYHKALGAMVGNWKAKTSFIMDPAQPAMEGEGSMTVEWILGGRYIQSSFKTEFMGEPFEGLGFTGYDVAHEEFISTWMDTMSTKIMLMTGGEEAGDALVMHGTATTPMGDNPMKIVSKFTDANTWVDSFYDKMPDGTWYNSGTITYTRD
ncbi:MAG: DUF1579 domain-containing protein [Phycisphaerales bacterium]|nr:DUF1579 domain-containing protein [Phycisphaerales bacterium]